MAKGGVYESFYQHFKNPLVTVLYSYFYITYSSHTQAGRQPTIAYSLTPDIGMNTLRIKHLVFFSQYAFESQSLMYR
jgi:hypothetical protein